MDQPRFNYTRRDLAPRRRPPFRLLLVLVLVLVGVVALARHSPDKTTVRTAEKAEAKKKYSQPQTICLDAGHGGIDPGGLNGKVVERELNLTVAQLAQKQLEAKGYQVFMTRTTNEQTRTNGDRYNFCNAKKATILVSVHHNFFEDDSVDYATALYFKEVDKPLAQSILTATAAALRLDAREIVSFEDGVLSKSTMPAALAESFFLTNTTEYQLLTAPGSTRLQEEADGLVAGIVDYFQPKASPDPSVTPSTDRTVPVNDTP